MLPSFATTLPILTIFCVLIAPFTVTANYDNDGYRPTCCGSVNHNPVKANIRAVYNTPHQTQIMGADDRYWISGVTSQTLAWPAFSADPFPDPLGLQTVNCLNQLSASAGGIGLNGRDDIFFYEFSCNDTACPKTLARYQAYVANVDPKPALAFNSFIYNEDPFIIGLNTFEVSINAIAFNRSAYDPQRNCQILYRALNASNLGVSNDPLYSHGIQNGDHIHTSLIVADNKTASAADQADEAWSDILKILSKSSPPASLTDIIFVHIYLRNVSDLAAVDARYATFFPAGWKPPRTVIGPTIFPLPSQQGAKVGFRVIARTPRSGNCLNPVKTFNVPEVYNHAPSPLASSASTIGRFVYVGETFGTLTAQGPASVPTDLAVQMDQIITNLEAVAVERGADRKDLFWLEGHTSLPLSNYIPLTRGIISAYNWTRAPVPAFNLLGSGNPAGLPLSFVAVFWRDDENRALDPSPYPWAEFEQLFGVDADYCTSVTIANCPQPGWFFTSSPMTDRAALGAQGQGPVNKRYIGNTQKPAVRHERPLVSVSSRT